MRAVNDKDGLLLQASQDEFEAMVRNVDVKSKIMDQYADWKGVRYRLGGDTKRGIDCSAFVQRTFREQFGMDLPRSTYEQERSRQENPAHQAARRRFGAVPRRLYRAPCRHLFRQRSIRSRLHQQWCHDFQADR